MPETRPELIHVAGVQKGERAVVMTNSVVAGRQAGVDILINDEFASRKHFQLDATYEGWVLTNLSANGTSINGKRYKGDKKIILGTGDLIGIGSKALMLFVEPGHDPEKALEEYRKDHPEAAPKTPPVQPPQEPQAAQAKPPVQPQAQPPAPGTPPLPPQQQAKAAQLQQTKQSAQRTGVQPAIAAPDDKQAGPPAPEKDAAQEQAEAEAKKKSKTKKFIIYGVIYVFLLIGLIAVLMLRPKGDTTTAGGMPRILKPQEIENLFDRPLLPERERNDDAARQALENARKFAGNLTGKKPNAYYCVYYFREYMAYQPKDRRGLPEPDDETNFAEAKKYLVDKVKKLYELAWTYEVRGHWTDAYRTFEELKLYLPERDVKKDKEFVNIFFQNILDHMEYISNHRGNR